MQELSDKDLLSQYFNTRDDKVLGELYNRYLHLVYGVCLKYLKNQEKAKDAVFNIFEKLLHDIKNHDIKYFKSWLYIVAKNHCLMELRKGKADQKKHEQYTYELKNSMEFTQEFHLFNEQMKKERELDFLEECIEELNEQQNTCVKSFYLEKLTYQEISKQFELELNKVKSYIQNGKRNLKNCIENKLGDS